MSRSYQALIVDFGGVLTTPLQGSMERFADELEIEMGDLVRVALAAYSGEHDALVVGFETGRISEDDFARAFAERLSEVSGKTIHHEGIVDKIFGTLEAEEEMFEAVLSARRAGLKTALLSNSWGLGVYPRDRFTEMFDVVIISGEVGLRKPDPAIFTLTVERLGVGASECVFVDDHPGHLEAAREAGMATVLHRTPGETISELRDVLGNIL